MKTLLLALALAAPAAHADYNSDSAEGQITCKGTDLKVTINAQRKLISVTKNGETYQYIVGNRETDGDTYVAYTIQTGGLTLNFDDRGDSVEFSRSGKVALECNR